MSVPLLEARGLVFGYRPEAPVLRGVSLALEPGVFTCVLGPNGTGKTTLLRCLLGGLRPAAGQVLLEGRPLMEVPLRERARRVAYVPQVPTSAFAFTVRELVAMGRHAHQGALGLASFADREAVERALLRTGSQALADRTLEELSGGEAQCAMIARALAQAPRVLLLDEPTSHLDLRNQLSIYGLIRDLAHEEGVAALCIGHDVNLAARHADRLVLLRDGHVLAAGPPAEVLDAGVLGECYGVEVDLVDPGDGLPVVRARLQSS
ncbi:MAG: ABC transporter ATP-binding protein [Pseudomonadota bacterium]